jgi:glycerol-3-phosphate acyltransferase PlsY
MILLPAVLLGYLLGSIPTANGLARLRGVDLRRAGSGNPGANNARRVGGAGLGVAVLVVELGKGASAVLLGSAFPHAWGVAAVGLGAIAGNVYNPWYRFRGGQGLGISGGVLAAAVPAGFFSGVAAAAAVALATRSAPRGAIAGLLMMVVAVAWLEPVWWGVDPPQRLGIAFGTCALVLPRQLVNLRGQLRAGGRRQSRRGSSPDPS